MNSSSQTLSLEEAAKQAARKKQWAIALDYWNQLLEKFPNKFSANNGKAKALLELNQFEQAERIFSGLVKRHPNKIQGFRGLLQVAIRTNQLESSLKYCLMLQKKFPDHIPTYAQKGNILLKLNRLKEAEETFTYLIQHYPDNVEGFVGVVNIASVRHQPEQVLERCQVLQEKFPKNIFGYVTRGNTLIDLNRFSEAEQVFAHLSEIHPDKLQGFRGLLRVAARSQQWQLVVSRADYLQKNFPQLFISYPIKGSALLSLGRLDEAEQHFAQVSQTYPDRTDGLYGLCQVASQRKQWPLVLQHCKQLQKQFPDYLPSYILQGDALIASGHFQAAEQIFDKLIEQHPHEPEGFCGLARIAMQRQQWSLALQQWTAIIEKFSQQMEGYVGKVDALIHLEAFHSAEAELRLMHELYPGKRAVLMRSSRLAMHTQNWPNLDQIKAYIYNISQIHPDLTPKDSSFHLFDFIINSLIGSNYLAEVEEILEVFKSHSVRTGTLSIWHSRLLRARGENALAKQLCSDALKIDSEMAELAHLELAKYARQDFNLTEILFYCDHIEPSDRTAFTDASSLRCFTLISLDKTEQAKQKIRELIKWQPTSAAGYVFLSEILCFHDKNYASTVEVCTQAITHGVSDQRLYCYKAIALATLGKTDEALQFLANYLSNHYDSRLVEMAQAQVFRQHRNYQDALATVNRWLADGNFLPIKSTGSQCEFNIQYLQCEPTYHVNSAEKVSVVMTTYRRDDLLPVAIQSILGQTYRNIELIIVDDCSPDDTFDYLRNIAKTDNRIKLLKNSKNGGTYVSKNHGMSISSGKYVAFMDSDDWLHPQTLERQIETLQDPKTIAVMCGFFRVDENSNIEFKPEGPGGQAHITLCFKRSPVFETIGYFDAVRTGADTEHLERIARVFGTSTIKRIKFPLLVSTRHSKSITGGSSALGFPWYGPGTNDSLYAASFREWHKRISAQTISPYMPYPLQSRKFDAPAAMLP